MKIYEDRKMNAMYLIHNLQKVGNLKEGMEIIISTEDTAYYNGNFVKNKFSEDYNIDRLVPLLKDVEIKGHDIEYYTRLDNIIGNSILSFKEINKVKCLILTLSIFMVNNLKQMYHEDDYIVFSNLSLVNKYLPNLELISKTIGVGTMLVKVHTEDEINMFKKIVIDKILEKEEIANRLLSDEEVPGENGRIWTKNGYVEELKIISQLASQFKNSEDQMMELNMFFCSLNKTPMTLFKLLGLNLNKDIEIITRIFS